MMAFWDRWFRREESKNERAQPGASDRELVEHWVQSINDSIVQIRADLQNIPSLTLAGLDQSLEDRTHEVLSKLDALPEKIIGPLREIIDLSKREVLAELVRISSRYSAHDSHGSGGGERQVEKPIHEITRELTGKQKRLLGILLDSGFLSYVEIGEKLGITHESAKNLVNRLIKNTDKGRLFSKQETDQGIKVGVSSDVQDEILKKKHRTTPNDSHDSN
jgi:DNA-binding CsgD family transcriptional regulator